MADRAETPDETFEPDIPYDGAEEAGPGDPRFEPQVGPDPGQPGSLEFSFGRATEKVREARLVEIAEKEAYRAAHPRPPSKPKEPKEAMEIRHKATFIKWWALRIANPHITKSEAARQIGTSPQQLYFVIEKGLRLGWGQIDDPIDFMSTQLIPKAMKNMDELLTQKDKRATIEMLKGTAFPEYRDTKASQVQPRLSINVQFEPAPPQAQTVIEGQIVGVPKQLSISKELPASEPQS
jgi:hypothetical protein